MKIQSIHCSPYEIDLTTGSKRAGSILILTNDIGDSAKGEIAPLPGWSSETLSESLNQLEQHKERLLTLTWSIQSLAKDILSLNLLPSLSFALESALLTLLDPLNPIQKQISALFVGSREDVLKQAALRKNEGFTSAKLKVSQFSFSEAKEVIDQLKEDFFLRIDVNRAWETEESLAFFDQFPHDAFDYVEEPFKNPHDLHLFTHPLAVDESYPHNLSLKDLEKLPTLKALIYKPTLQGGYCNALSLKHWCDEHDIHFILSSSFESDIGLQSIVELAERLGVSTPLGIGTYFYLKDYLNKDFELKHGVCSIEMTCKV